ncbi:Signal transduction histidine-protein kinase/phosphatase UhpB [Acaryochloris thomasi RCC1774]|uniref:histidine kinase n=1 Tax=Acaryochloris thomasi RCC1774 TaxID=1764569 RepID=A0A2W1K5D8_9CYAN|nr:sensor histidine kinase [Acaryochloris thomasi]PZD75111.1 Signal transduction histidine-protein kinase/phosphatase UhpB [Acaryochloris thomasi RCC1774]
MSLVSTPSILSRRTMRHIDWLLIVMSLVLGSLEGRYTLSAQITLQLLTFYGVFFLLSFITPLNRQRGPRLAYVGFNVLVFTMAASASLSFPLQMYWFLAKSCFSLGRRDAIMTTVLTGASFLLAYRWNLPNALALLAERGIERWLDPNYIFFNQLSFYMGASSFTLVFVHIVIAEQKSRYEAEALTQQVKTLAATLERTRIARDIHDSLGHSLTTLDVQLELAQQLYQRDSVKTEESLNKAKRLTSQCLDEVRRSVQTMRAEKFDLNDAIAALTDSIHEKQSLTLHQDLCLPPLPSQVGHQLYCIIQEGLTNIQKHAGATAVTLKGNQDTNGITVVLHDNGQGFNPSTPHEGFGIRGMRERTQLLEGDFTVQSTVGEGTFLKVVIPYPTEPA